MKTTLEEFKEEIFNGKGAAQDFDVGEQVQLKVKENHRTKNSPIFVRENGKVGFPTFNSISINIGDTIQGVIRLESDQYFFVEVQKKI